MTFADFFSHALGTAFTPYAWQGLIAEKGLPPVLPIPTGLGKTEGVVLAWAYRRFIDKKEDEPLHLIYCLPMRTLVRQTAHRLRCCVANLQKRSHIAVAVYELMGGSINEEWVRSPDKPWILVGTQDQLLSRALNRGYSMNRFEWPVHFGLLNQDCHWIIDEVQLMGPGLWTSAQLDWMRTKRFHALKPCKSTWMSATTGAAFLATTDRKQDGVDELSPDACGFIDQLAQCITNDRNVEAKHRREARRPVAWFQVRSRSDQPLEQQIAQEVALNHRPGTMSLVVCNTVDTARHIFEALEGENKLLVTSRFRRVDRERNEQRLLDFEARRRQHLGKEVPGHPGLICVSTQVVEAGLDVSAHQLWSELAPWPSVIQRLGRLNRDGRDMEAHAWFWETPEEGRAKPERAGPYEADAVAFAKRLMNALIPLAQGQAFPQALESLQKKHRAEIDEALQPKLTSMPRALDVHGLFSTERDVHGGFTDISGFVRGTDPDADLTVFWRDWSGKAPPRGDELDGPEFKRDVEGCAVPFFRLREFLRQRKESGWLWNEDADRWERVSPTALCPGMIVMLHGDAGGYDSQLGWTGDKRHVLVDVPRAGRGRALRDDGRTEIGYWARLEVHLADARSEGGKLCDALGLKDPVRAAVVEASGLHDLGKAHPQWQSALPAVSALTGGPWAKCPRVLAVDVASDGAFVRAYIDAVRPDAVFLGEEIRRHHRNGLRLRWAIGDTLKREELDGVRAIDGVQWVGHVPFRPGLRHEAASALAMWKRYRENQNESAYPALAVYLAAAHHGKVRTVLRAITDEGEDVFGVMSEPGAVELSGKQWPFDFSVAKDGAEGEWKDDRFVLTGYGWTGLVADLLGPWRKDQKSEVGAVPPNEPRHLGPFALAYLEALVRVADWRASASPSRSITPSDINKNGGGEHAS